MTEYELRYSFALSAAEQVFEFRETAEVWLNTPLYPLGGKRPVDLLQTEEGLRSVMAVLRSVEYGGVA